MLGSDFYEYRPIRSELSEIRIIVLTPAIGFWAPIHCRIEHVFLTESPSYYALSYVWSDPPGHGEIFLIGQHSPKAVKTTANLECALRHLQSRKEEVRLWADAICIDQNNEEEKGEQIPLMGMIYSKALSDFLWMGPRYRNYDLAMKIFGRTFSPQQEHAHLEIKPLIHHALEFNIAIWRQICTLFENTVWTRMWIVQELALASGISLLVGRREVPWHTVVSIASYILSIPRIAKQLTENALYGVGQVTDIASLPREHSADLLQVWCKFGWCKCQVPQDRIFAILNIVTNLSIKPNYKLDCRNLYCSVTKTYITQNKDLKILDFIYDGHDPSTADHLPTWAPDFGGGSTPYQIPFEHDRYSKKQDLPLLPWTDMSTLLLQRSNELELELIGIHLDIITYVSIATRDMSADAVNSHYLAMADQLEKDMTPSARYFTGELLLNAFTITLCWGYVRSNYNDYTSMYRLGVPDSFFMAQSQLAKAPKKRQYRRGFSTSSKFKKPDKKAKVIDETKYAFREHIISSTLGQVYAATKEGYMALVPDGAREGDIICALNGRAMPYVLRGHTRNGKRLHTLDNGQRVEPENWTRVRATCMHGMTELSMIQESPVGRNLVSYPKIPTRLNDQALSLPQRTTPPSQRSPNKYVPDQDIEEKMIPSSRCENSAVDHRIPSSERPNVEAWQQPESGSGHRERIKLEQGDLNVLLQDSSATSTNKQMSNYLTKSSASSLSEKRATKKRRLGPALTLASPLDVKRKERGWRIVDETEKRATQSDKWVPVTGNKSAEMRIDLGRAELASTPGWQAKLTPTRRGEVLFLNVQ